MREREEKRGEGGGRDQEEREEAEDKEEFKGGSREQRKKGQDGAGSEYNAGAGTTSVTIRLCSSLASFPGWG